MVSLLLAALLSWVFPAASSAGERLKVVASIAPYADFARQVGGDHVDVTLLLPPGASPHTFEPTPRMVQQVARAQVFLKNGAGLEFWAEKLVKAASSALLVINASEGLDLIRLSPTDRHGRDQGSFDPHIWLDPTVCISIVGKIESAFARVDPAHAASYRERAAAYAGELKRLDSQILETVRSFRTRSYVSFHAAWNYFSRRYGLSVAGVIEEGPGKEPSPKHVSALLGRLKGLKNPVIFAESQFNPKIAETLAREAGARVFILDPVGGQPGRESYVAMMRYNVSVMAEALR